MPAVEREERPAARRDPDDQGDEPDGDEEERDGATHGADASTAHNAKQATGTLPIACSAELEPSAYSSAAASSVCSEAFAALARFFSARSSRKIVRSSFTRDSDARELP